MIQWPPPDVASRWGGVSSSEQGLQYWPPDIAPAGVPGLMSGLGGGALQRGPNHHG